MLIEDMSLKIEDKDKKYINSINKELEENPNSDMPIPISKMGEYYIQFKILDIGKANNFLFYLLLNNEKTKEFEDNTGIRIKSLNCCCGDNKISELKDFIQKFSDELEKLEERL